MIVPILIVQTTLVWCAFAATSAALNDINGSLTKNLRGLSYDISNGKEGQHGAMQSMAKHRFKPFHQSSNLPQLLEHKKKNCHSMIPMPSVLTLQLLVVSAPFHNFVTCAALQWLVLSYHFLSLNAIKVCRKRLMLPLFPCAVN